MGIPWNKGKTGLQKAWNKGIPCRETTKEKLKIINTGKHPSKETIGKIRIAMKNRRLTEEHKRKIGIACKGRKHTEYSKEKMSRSRKNPPESTIKKLHESHIGKNTGIKNHRWKGGITPHNHKIRSSTEYKLWRESIFERDKYTCRMCGKGGYLHAHHLWDFAKFPELRLAINNGITLCRSCHKKVHTKGRE